MDILDRMLAHNLWATRVLLEQCKSLGTDEYNREFAIGVGTLHKTLAHIINAMNSWAAIMATGAPPAERRDLAAECSTPDDLLVELSRTHELLVASIDTIRNENLLDDISELVHPVTKMCYRFTRGTMATHVLTHGMHHRAQVLQMLRQLGREDLPDVDMLEWEVVESVGSREPAE